MCTNHMNLNGVEDSAKKLAMKRRLSCYTRWKRRKGSRFFILAQKLNITWIIESHSKVLLVGRGVGQGIFIQNLNTCWSKSYKIFLFPFVDLCKLYSKPVSITNLWGRSCHIRYCVSHFSALYHFKHIETRFHFIR